MTTKKPNPTSIETTKALDAAREMRAKADARRDKRILEMAAERVPQTEIAAALGIGRTCVQNVLARKERAP